MYSALEIANYFIKLSKEQHKPIDNMKLQKLVYIAHGYYLGSTGEYLINEAIQAWEYGPVINSLYHAFKKYGTGDVTEYYTENTNGFFPKKPMLKEKNTEIMIFLTLIWESYGKLSGIQLSNLTHEEDTPWMNTFKEYKEELPQGATIDPAVIKKYYEEKLKEVE